jgi:signal transduction histidine kinase
VLPGKETREPISFSPTAREIRRRIVIRLNIIKQKLFIYSPESVGQLSALTDKVKRVRASSRGKMAYRAKLGLSDSGDPIRKLKALSWTPLVLFAAVTCAIWGATASIAISMLSGTNRTVFETLLEANQEALASGQWRSAIEGMERSGSAVRAFRNVRACWTPGPRGCETAVGPTWFESTISVPVMSGNTPLLWVTAEFSYLLVFELVCFASLAFFSTFFLGWLISRRVRNDANLLHSEFSRRVAKAASGCDSESILNLPPEVRPLGMALAKNQAALDETKRSKEYSEIRLKLAQQVAHDIRSPLAALKVASAKTMPPCADLQYLIEAAIARIQDIADSLSSPGSRSQLPTGDGRCETEPRPELVCSVIDRLVREKQLQYTNRPNIALSIHFEVDVRSLFAKIVRSAFLRALSNIIDNAAEAIVAEGSVQLRVSRSHSDLLIRIADNGCGIDSHQLSRVFERGVTFGKAGGSGLGLSFARESILSFGGDITIISRKGFGTEVEVRIPISERPAWLANEVVVPESASLCVVDDDPLMRESWIRKLHASDKARSGRQVLEFASPEELVAHLANPLDDEKGIRVFLVDYRFTNSKVNGLELIKKCNIEGQSVIVTGQHEGIIDECEKLGVKVLPKYLAPETKVTYL